MKSRLTVAFFEQGDLWGTLMGEIPTGRGIPPIDESVGSLAEKEWWRAHKTGNAHLWCIFHFECSQCSSSELMRIP